MVSSLTQPTSTRQDGNLDLKAGEIAAQWVRFAFVVAAAALNTKAMTLWSESRMLRKIRARHPEPLRDSLISEHPDHAFAELYVGLSKGRHRSYSRYYSLLYYIFTFLLDTIDVIEFITGGSFNPDVFSLGELTAFRMLVYVGSFATFGALNFTVVQNSLLVFCNLTLATLHIVFGYGILRLSRAVRYGLAALQMTLILSFFFMRIILRRAEHRTSLAGIVSGMAYVREKNFHDPNLELIDLRKSLSEQQSKRLEQMEDLASKYRNFDENKARELVGWWDTDFGDFVIFCLVSGVSALVWGQLSKDHVPRVVFIDCLEAVSTFLLFINNSVVEKMLFVKLLQIARVPKSGFRGTSRFNGHGSSGTL